MTEQETQDFEEYKKLFDVPIEEFDHTRAFLHILRMSQEMRRVASDWHGQEIIRIEAEEAKKREAEKVEESNA